MSVLTIGTAGWYIFGRLVTKRVLKAEDRVTLNEIARIIIKSTGVTVRVLRRPVIRPDVQLLRLAIVAEGGD